MQTQIQGQEKIHFITATVVDWVDACPQSRETLQSGQNPIPLSPGYLRFNCNHRKPIPLDTSSDRFTSFTIFTPSMV